MKYTKEKTERINIRVSPKQKRAWTEAAESAGLTFTELFEILMNRHLEASEK